ncbi:cold-shock protein [Novosphingopyxis sp. YJ-S2-01]|uniref:cold-shock protein n=1 Tax=Novosphingopyxis sp. YJ-S2-01 TaxID=2794021 RepID=UPI0018DE2865|nr:cold-shock protein [Novosphingopyxis sp. YJ-S2-01]MBH9538166.1 cold-shock protein [Novosphingopyxis sp. YJ-S2-01]
MTHYGKIKSYDSSSGTGSITPEKGGEALRFKKADLQQEGHMPKVDERFSYETSEVDGGKKSAVNLQHQQGDGQSQKGQARAQQG